MDAPNLPPTPKLLPWHDQSVEQLRRAWGSGRFSHALLLQGPEGIGKKHAAAWLAASVLCEASRGGRLDRCGECASCKLIDAGTHPDLTWVRPEEDKQQISIDQVRAACERLSKTSYLHGYKVAVIEPAHQMTPGAANSVLKTLEEPAQASLLLLITSRPSALLPTVRSRCQKVSFPAPSLDIAKAWLEAEAGQATEADLLAFSGGAPLRALEQANGGFDALHEQMQKTLTSLLNGRADVTQVAGEWADDKLPDRLIWLDRWLSSLARSALVGSADRVTFPSRPVHLPSPAHTLNISGVYGLVERARALKAQLSRTALQRELAVASWLFALLDLMVPPAAPQPRNAPLTRSR